MQEKVKCFYCEYLALQTKTSGQCYKDKRERKIAEPRECKMFNLAPIHCVAWRKQQLKK